MLFRWATVHFSLPNAIKFGLARFAAAWPNVILFGKEKHTAARKAYSVIDSGGDKGVLGAGCFVWDVSLCPCIHHPWGAAWFPVSFLAQSVIQYWLIKIFKALYFSHNVLKQVFKSTLLYLVLKDWILIFNCDIYVHWVVFNQR